MQRCVLRHPAFLLRRLKLCLLLLQQQGAQQALVELMAPALPHAADGLQLSMVGHRYVLLQGEGESGGVGRRAAAAQGRGAGAGQQLLQ